MACRVSRGVRSGQRVWVSFDALELRSESSRAVPQPLPPRRTAVRNEGMMLRLNESGSYLTGVNDGGPRTTQGNEVCHAIATR